MRRPVFTYTAISIAILGLLSAALAGQFILAFIRQSNYELVQGLLYQGDLTVEAAAIDLGGDVTGDVFLKALYLKASGTIGGNLSIWTGGAELRGTVEGNVYARAANLRVYGTIKGDLVVYGGSVTLVEGASVHGQVRLNAVNITVTANSEIRSELVGRAASVILEGQVLGDVSLTASAIDVAPTARLGQRLHYRSFNGASVDPDAKIDGPVVRVHGASNVPRASILLWRNGALAALSLIVIVGMGSIFLGGAGISHSFPTKMAGIFVLLVRGIGVLTLVPIALAVLSMFVITIPFVAVAVVFFLAWAIVGVSRGTIAIGEIVVRRMWEAESRGSAILSLIAGTAILFVAMAWSHNWVAVALMAAVPGAGLAATGSPADPAGRPPHGQSALVWGGMAGAISTFLALAALTLGAVASAAALVTVSGSAALVWEYSPLQLGFVAWAMASLSLILPILAYESMHVLESRHKVKAD